ncbi:MAG: hypothetical protein A2Y38_13375 [Spirochaetes bacterium GWB1_59_5]|nr:MAG: hypothetical protein A2Y38_13375 [Spirochaetes bacterium GWB1_59_5]
MVILGAGADQLASLDLGEALPAQVRGEVLQDRGLHLESREDLRVAQADHAVVQHRFRGELLRVLVHRHRQARHRARHDLEVAHLHLVAARGLVVGRHPAAGDHHRLRGRLRLALQHALGRADVRQGELPA